MLPETSFAASGDATRPRGPPPGSPEGGLEPPLTTRLFSLRWSLVGQTGKGSLLLSAQVPVPRVTREKCERGRCLRGRAPRAAVSRHPAWPQTGLAARGRTRCVLRVCTAPYSLSQPRVNTLGPWLGEGGALVSVITTLSCHGLHMLGLLTP